MMIRPCLRTARRIATRVAATPPVARRLLRHATVVFLYHDVSDTPSPFNDSRELNVSPSIFRKQLELIGETFHVIDPPQLLSGDYPTPAALITFDDGNRSYAHNALPILKEKGMASVSFLNMGPIHGEVCWSGLAAFLSRRDPSLLNGGHGTPRKTVSQISETDIERRLASPEREALLTQARVFRGSLLSHDDVRALAGEPLVCLGNHLFNHYNAARLPTDRLVQEYQKNQRWLDAHPRGVRFFSYPFGQPGICLTEATTRLLRREGAEALFTAYPLPNISRRPSIYHRVQLSSSVQTMEALYHAVLQNYLSARVRAAFKVS